jgi:6,7-dimethyl-8-ribityllumazine synthase
MGYDEAGDDWNSDYPTMSVHRPKWQPVATGKRFAILVARFNAEITENLEEGAKKAFAEAGAESFDVSHIPGAFELPLAAKLTALTHHYHAIVALGAVIRGGTPHFDYVCAESARGLQNVALETGVPIAFGVLTCDTMEQARERAGWPIDTSPHGNKGYDAAMAAIEMAHFASMVGVLTAGS